MIKYFLHCRAKADSWTEIIDGGISRPERMSCFNCRKSWYLKYNVVIIWLYKNPALSSLNLNVAHLPGNFLSQICWVTGVELDWKPKPYPCETLGQNWLIIEKNHDKNQVKCTSFCLVGETNAKILWLKKFSFSHNYNWEIECIY